MAANSTVTWSEATAIVNAAQAKWVTARPAGKADAACMTRDEYVQFVSNVSPAGFSGSPSLITRAEFTTSAQL